MRTVGILGCPKRQKKLNPSLVDAPMGIFQSSAYEDAIFERLTGLAVGEIKVQYDTYFPLPIIVRTHVVETPWDTVIELRKENKMLHSITAGEKDFWLLKQAAPRHISLRTAFYLTSGVFTHPWHTPHCTSCFRIIGDNTKRGGYSPRCETCEEQSLILRGSDKLSMCIIWLWQNAQVGLLCELKTYIENIICALSVL